MVTELEMACHMWNRYTKNVIRFGTVEIHLNRTLSIINRSNCGDTVICEFGRLSDEPEFITFVRESVSTKGGRTVVDWESSDRCTYCKDRHCDRTDFCKFD